MYKPAGLFLLAGCLLLVFAATSFADLYKYTDARGVVVITDKLESVPARFRSSVKVIRDAKPAPAAEPAAAVDQGAQPAAAPAAETANEGKFAELCSRFPWLKPILWIAAIAAAFVCLTQIVSLLPSPLLGRALYIAFTLGVLLLLYKFVAGSMAENSKALVNDATSLVKKVNERQQERAPADPNSVEQAK
ncbi:DUF4124 domain-containing protein [Geomonas sp. Red32]|uniref:DUF4124 domain-containing protein n=1 Tax=Geomonas sp. Red32 TaxID=2912856 RepID=UPI00202D0176|nr:DUF4124 domain-containing protein [Geomonas sp. Red32]MCM0081845.1 DUF4124 domain-containing protein [Geomonas sp. Red32]